MARKRDANHGGYEDDPRPGSWLYSVTKALGDPTDDQHLSWASVDQDLLLRAILSAIEEGGVVQLGISKSGTSFSWRVWSPDGVFQRYPASVVEMERVLRVFAMDEDEHDALLVAAHRRRVTRTSRPATPSDPGEVV